MDLVVEKKMQFPHVEGTFTVIQEVRLSAKEQSMVAMEGERRKEHV